MKIKDRNKGKDELLDKPLFMRITGGRFTGRRIEIPRGDLEVRPLMDRMRESLFSIIGTLTGFAFLDLFSGSGAAALEAASRGAENIDLVELDGAKRDVIEKNISFAKEFCNIRLYIQDVFEFVVKTHNMYEIVYADPPFPLGDKLKIAESVLRAGIIKESGRFIIHIPKDELSLWREEFLFDNCTDVLKQYDVRTYGRNCFLFYKVEKLQGC